MVKLYDLHGAGSITEIDPESKKKTYINHKDFNNKYGVDTKVVIDEIADEEGNLVAKCQIFKKQDTTLLEQQNAVKRTDFTGYNDLMTETFSIPVLLYNKMLDGGVHVSDYKEMINIIERDYPCYRTTPKWLTTRRKTI